MVLVIVDSRQVMDTHISSLEVASRIGALKWLLARMSSRVCF